MDTKKIYAILAAVMFVFALIGTQALAGEKEKADSGHKVYGQEKPAPSMSSSTSKSDEGTMEKEKPDSGHKVYGQEKPAPSTAGSTSQSEETTMGAPKDAPGQKIYGQDPAK